MVYLKPLFSRLDRLSQRKSSPFSTEAHQEHVKMLIFKMSYILSKKIGTVDPRSSGGHLRVMLIYFGKSFLSFLNQNMSRGKLSGSFNMGQFF